MKIVFLEPLGLKVEDVEMASSCLREMGHEVVVNADRSPEKNIERAKGADIVVESNMPLRKEFFEARPTVKMLSIAFTGLDHIDMVECERRGIEVKNAAGYSTEAVAEETLCMMIGLYRKVIENDSILRACERGGVMPGRELRGKTVGIVGLGAIGQRVAQIVRVFGCDVIAWNRTPRDIEGVKMVDKETLFREADIVCVHLALNDATRNFISARELKLMKPSAILVNAARGPVVNTTDLAEALKNGALSAAATDVFDGEPPLKKDNPLLSAPNTMLLPHIGFATKEAFVDRLHIVVENIKQYLLKNNVK